MLFAGYWAINASTAPEMQHNIDLLANACSRFSFTISIEKTGHVPGKPYIDPDFKIN